jgi:hypothetical protein
MPHARRDTTMPWDSESAKKAAERSAEVRRQNRDRPTEEKVKVKAAAKADQIMERLIKASLGEDEFAALDLGKQVDSMKTVLAYGIGRPTTGKSSAPEPDKEDDDPPEEMSLV